MPCHHFCFSLFSLPVWSDAAVHLYFKWVLFCHSSSDINRKITFMKSEGVDLIKEKFWDLFHHFRPVNWVQLSSGRDWAKDSQGWWCPMPGKERCRMWVPCRVMLGEQSCRSWQSLSVCVPRGWGGGWEGPDMPGTEDTGIPFLCAALQVHPCSSKGQLQMFLSRSKSRRATWNLPGKRK